MIDWKSAIGGAVAGAFLWNWKLKRDAAMKNAALAAGVQAATRANLPAPATTGTAAPATGTPAPGGQISYQRNYPMNARRVYP